MTHAWLSPTLERISDLLDMPDRHNSSGTPKVSPLVALDAIRFLTDHVRPEDEAPRIVATAEGGLQFEWNGRTTFCSAIFYPDGKVLAAHGEKSETWAAAVDCGSEAGLVIERALAAFRSEAA